MHSKKNYSSSLIPNTAWNRLNLLILFILLFFVIACTPLASRQSTTSIINSVIFISDSGQEVKATYRDNKTVTLTFPNGRTAILLLAVSASGARYVAGTSEWWEHQGEATYSINDEPVFIGKLQLQPDH